MTRILLTSVCRPFGAAHGDGFLTTPQALYALLWAQGPFRVEDHAYHWGLDAIAANIQAPTVVLHYPTLGELRRELARGYDYVGISFVPATFHKLQAMVPLIREVAPRAPIILGGHGTGLSDDELRGHGDLICREEGIGYMRGLLGEPEQPYRNPPVFLDAHLFTIVPVGETGVIFVGLGCTRGCDFCGTSAYFKRRRIRFLQRGEELLDAILELRSQRPRLSAFVIYDEDFLQDRKFCRAYLEAVRRTDIPLALSVFGSIRSVSKYDPRELAEMGISTIWIGFEGAQGGYEAKSGGDLCRLVEDLRQVGISTTLSMIIGLEHHTEPIIDQELRTLLAMRPRMTQFMLLCPSRGSPLFQRLQQEGRLNEAALHRHPLHDGSHSLFVHPHLSAATLEAELRDCYRQEYEELGPSIFRQIETQLRGYRSLRGAGARRLRVRAEMLRASLSRAHAAFRAGRLLAPNRRVAAWIGDLERELVAELGQASLSQEIWSGLAVGLAAGTALRHRWGMQLQPRPRVHRYRYGRS